MRFHWVSPLVSEWLWVSGAGSVRVNALRLRSRARALCTPRGVARWEAGEGAPRRRPVEAVWQRRGPGQGPGPRLPGSRSRSRQVPRTGQHDPAGFDSGNDEVIDAVAHAKLQQPRIGRVPHHREAARAADDRALQLERRHGRGRRGLEEAVDSSVLEAHIGAESGTQAVAGSAGSSCHGCHHIPASTATIVARSHHGQGFLSVREDCMSCCSNSSMRITEVV